MKVAYDVHSVGPPIFSAKDAVDQNSFFPVHFLVAPNLKPIDDIAEGFAAGDLKLENVQVMIQLHCNLECINLSVDFARDVTEPVILGKPQSAPDLPKIKFQPAQG